MAQQLAVRTCSALGGSAAGTALPSVRPFCCGHDRGVIICHAATTSLHRKLRRSAAMVKARATAPCEGCPGPNLAPAPGGDRAGALILGVCLRSCAAQRLWSAQASPRTEGNSNLRRKLRCAQCSVSGFGQQRLYAGKMTRFKMPAENVAHKWPVTDNRYAWKRHCAHTTLTSAWQQARQKMHKLHDKSCYAV